MDKKTISNLKNKELVKTYKHASKKHFLGQKSKIEKELKNRKINPNSKYSYLCNNPEDVFGDVYPDSSNLIIIKINKDNFLCQTRTELEHLEKVAYYIIEEKNNIGKKFYRLPYFSMLIDKSSMDEMIRKKANTMELQEKEKVEIFNRGKAIIYKVVQIKRCDLYEGKNCQDKDEWTEEEEEEEEVKEKIEPILTEEMKAYIAKSQAERNQLQDLRPYEMKDASEYDESEDLDRWGDESITDMEEDLNANASELYRDPLTYIARGAQESLIEQYPDTVTVQTEEDLSPIFFGEVDTTDASVIYIKDSVITNLDFVLNKFKTIVLERTYIPEINVPVHCEVLDMFICNNDNIILDSLSHFEKVFVINCSTTSINCAGIAEIDYFHARGCANLSDLPVMKVKSINIIECGINVFESIDSTEEIILTNLDNLTSIPHLPEGLKRLILGECPNLVTLPENLPESLQFLQIRNCPSLPRIPNRTNPNTVISYIDGDGNPLPVPNNP
jgi:hypothetical protein